MAYTTASLSGALLTLDGRAIGAGVVDLPAGARLLIDTIVGDTEEGDLLGEIAVARDDTQGLRDQAQVLVTEMTAIRDEALSGVTVAIDTDGIPYLTTLAGSPESPVQYDTDGVPYITIGA